MIQRLFDDEHHKVLLAFAPFILVVSSLLSGFRVGLLVASLLLLQTILILFIRKLIPLQLRLPAIFIVSISLILTVKMLLNAEAYSIAEELSIFLPLILINSLALSVTEAAFSINDVKPVLVHSFSIGILVLLFFLTIGFLIKLLDEISISTSPAICLLLSGFLFAMVNFLKSKSE